MKAADAISINLADTRLKGQWVALWSFNSKRVAGFGRTPVAAARKAKTAGAKRPVLVLIPKDDQSLAVL
jgi:hypothetical protein